MPQSSPTSATYVLEGKLAHLFLFIMRVQPRHPYLHPRKPSPVSSQRRSPPSYIQKTFMQATGFTSRSISFPLLYTGLFTRIHLETYLRPSHVSSSVLCFVFLCIHANQFVVLITKHIVKAQKPDGHDVLGRPQKNSNSLFRPPQMSQDPLYSAKRHLARDSNSTHQSLLACSSLWHFGNILLTPVHNLRWTRLHTHCIQHWSFRLSKRGNQFSLLQVRNSMGTRSCSTHLWLWESECSSCSIGKTSVRKTVLDLEHPAYLSPARHRNPRSCRSLGAGLHHIQHSIPTSVSKGKQTLSFHTCRRLVGSVLRNCCMVGLWLGCTSHLLVDFLSAPQSFRLEGV